LLIAISTGTTTNKQIKRERREKKERERERERKKESESEREREEAKEGRMTNNVRIFNGQNCMSMTNTKGRIEPLRYRTAYRGR
jgi:septal ring factor EnvC (AmiA/AmiB activator)